MSSWLAFFLFFCGFQQKIELSSKNFLIWTSEWGRAKHQKYCQKAALIIFLSAIAVMQVIFWNKVNFCFISDCMYSFNGKFKKLISKRKIFYSPANALCSYENSADKRFITSNFHWYVLLVHLVQSANTEYLLMKTHCVLNLC